MTDGFYEIVIVCAHAGRPHQGKTRVIERLSWVDDDPEFVEALRSDMAEEETEEELQIVLLNQRFARSVTWKNRRGVTVRPDSSELDYLDGSGAEARAGALGGWRFQCRCGINRPVRQSTLDEWIRSRLADDPTRRVHEFEISH